MRWRNRIPNLSLPKETPLHSPESIAGQSEVRPTRSRLATTIILLAYLLALMLWRDSVPAGLNNDVAEETLRGLLLLDAGRFEVITSVIGIPQETLYLYLTATAAKILGTTTLAPQVVGWCFALATVWMLMRLVERILPRAPAWIPWLVATSSVWLFHYSRTGLRAVSAPFFLLAFSLLLERAERPSHLASPASYASACAAGAVLALGIYSYTACRVLAVALLLHTVTRVIRETHIRPHLLRLYAALLLTAGVVSIPNLLYLLQSPHDFLFRGGYVLTHDFTGVGTNLAASFLLPFHYLDRYRSLFGTHHVFDGVSASLTTAGIAPLHPVIAIAFAAGVIASLRRSGPTVVPFLLWTLLSATLLLGIAGPSLTRFFVALPAYLVFATIGFATLTARYPRIRPFVLAALSALLLSAAHGYFVEFADNDKAQKYFSPAATPIGQRARELAGQDLRVIALVVKDANVIAYLNYDRPGTVIVLELPRRPSSTDEIPLASFHPDRLLIERDRGFADLDLGGEATHVTQASEFFYEVAWKN